jgi:hypothetical protein
MVEVLILDRALRIDVERVAPGLSLVGSSGISRARAQSVFGNFPKDHNAYSIVSISLPNIK